MPHLQFDVNRPISKAVKISFASGVRKLFSDVMDTGTEHIAISIREFATYDLSIGLVEEPEKGVALVNADVREGRTLEQRRTLALGLIDLLQKSFDIPGKHIYVTLTEHKGEDFHLIDRYLSSWREGEDPLAD